MSLMHPVGPEPPETYWGRRALVIVAVLLVLIGMGMLVAKAADRGTRTAAPPADPSTQLPTFSSGPQTATPTPSPSWTPAPTLTPSQQATSAPTPSRTATPAPTPARAATPTPTPSRTPTPTPTPARAATASPSPSGSAHPMVACRPADLRPTLTASTHDVPQHHPVTLSVSIINGSDARCEVAVTPATFELKVYSGTDRIWSTADCGTSVKPVHAVLGSQQALEWTQTWSGLRSRAGCHARPEIPRPGTYFATAELRGAPSVQWRLQVRA